LVQLLARPVAGENTTIAAISTGKNLAILRLACITISIGHYAR
jgi:hypothetical protein